MKKYLILLSSFMMIIITSCDIVEDGYTVDYSQSDAILSVEAIGLSTAAPGEMISFRISVDANEDIKSCIVSACEPGATGSGFDVGTVGYDDPFADHNFGTVKKNVNSFVVKYDYIVPEDGVDTRIDVTVVESSAKAVDSLDINVVAPIVEYLDISLYAKDNLNFDAFASISGLVYTDVKTNYSSTSEVNCAVQEDIDIVFYVQDGLSVLSSTAYSGLRIELDVENETKFMREPDITSTDFDNATAAMLVEMTKEDSIGIYGEDAIFNLKVGEVISFVTDISAKHSAKTGLIRINQLHPVSIAHYEGKAYVMECDVISQITN